MAGEWIKFEASTPEKQEVFAITAAMQWDDPDLTVGKLLKVWRWFDQQTIAGNAPSVTFALLDRISGVSGFAKAMCDAGWLVQTADGFMLPHFDRHNGKTAKDRALTAKRVAKHKSNDEGNAQGNAAIVSSPLPKEEKRREENKEDTPPALQSAPARKSSSMTLATYLANCKRAEAKPIPDTDPVFAYADSIGLSRDFLLLNWQQFKDRYLDDTKRYTDWPKVFRTSVKQSWFKLWFVSQDGGYALTTVGQQAKRANEGHS